MSTGKHIWNIVLQKFDEEGKEIDFDITSFTSQELAVAKYDEWMSWDMQDKDVEILEREKTYPLEHWYKRGNEITRCVVKDSYLFDTTD